MLTCQRIPLVSVGDTIQERSAVVAAVSVVHGGVVVRVHLGQVEEHVVVRGEAGPAHHLTAWRRDRSEIYFVSFFILKYNI